MHLIYCDLPFKMTQNRWDNIIPLEWMWSEFNRILKPNGVIVLHAMEMFSTLLMSTNPKQYKYKWFWKKGNKPTGFLNAKKQPLRIMEEVLVFYDKQCIYNPQMVKGNPCHSVGKAKDTSDCQTDNYGEYIRIETEGDLKYPQTLLEFPRDKEKLHPTQKPLLLAEYIINTYTNEDDIVLDITAGVCTSGLAAEKLNRKWINIERDKDEKGNCLGYCEKAVNRFKKL
jgi:site-specific DNA-methyltransferase (adenine-specific)